MRPIDFNDLPRATRERFVRSLVSVSPSSRPLAQRVSKPRSALGWYVLAIVASIGLVALVAFRFGAPASPVQDRRFLGGYVAAAAGLGLAVSMLGRRRALVGSLPFAPGVYVFPLDLVDARTRQLELYSLAELQSLDLVHHGSKGKYERSVLWFIFPAQSFVLEIRGQQAADTQYVAVQRARERLAAALHRGDLGELTTLDPFADARARNFEPAHDHGLLARGRPTWTRFIWAITIISGLSGGVAAWRLRNWRSDRRAFARVATAADSALADAYARGGGQRVAALTSEVLPRARLAEANQMSDPWKRAEAIERLLATHPAPLVAADARTAHAAALKDAVAGERTVSGLRAFLTRWPDSPEAPIAKAKIRSIYHEALADFRAHANVSDRSVAPVLEALLAHAGEHVEPVEVRFRQRTAGSLVTADALLAKGLLEDDKPARGGGAPLGRCFGDEGRREVALAMGLQRSLRTVFPAELLALRAGARLDEPVTAPGTKPLPEVTAPTLVIDYELGWAGTTYVARESGRRFLGVLIGMQVNVQVPNEPRVLSFTVRAEAPATLPVQAAADDAMAQALVVPGSSPEVTDDARVYAAILSGAFDEIGAKLLSVFFEPKTAAAREARESVASPAP